jgi:dihydroorotate dehydrogenase
MSARLSTVLPAPQSACLRRQLISSAPRRAFSSPARGQPLRPSPTSKPSPNSAAKRYQSTASSSDAPSRLPAILYGTAALAVGGLAWYLITDVRFSAHRYITVPALRWWFEDAEEAHHAGVKGLKVLDRIGLGPRDRCTEGGLEVEVGLCFTTHWSAY